MIRDTEIKIYLTLEEKLALHRIAPQLKHQNRISRATVSTLVREIVIAALRGENFLASCSLEGTKDVTVEQQEIYEEVARSSDNAIVMRKLKEGATS